MATGSKATEPAAAPAAAAPERDALVADLQAENKRLKAELDAAGVRPASAPAEPSFAMAEGTRQELELLAAQAERDGRAVDEKLPNGNYRYSTRDPFTGKTLTPKDLPAAK